MANALEVINAKLDALPPLIAQIPPPGPTPAQLAETAGKVDAIATQVAALIPTP